MRVTLLIGLLLPGLARADGLDEAARRGKKALLARPFNPPAFRLAAYENVWKQWGLKEKPADLDRLFRERYGLHEAPFPNGRYPMGLRESTGLLGKGLTTDCMACHGGSIMGKSIVGLPNTTVDYHALYEELFAADGGAGRVKFHFTRVRGTTEAGAMSVFLLSLRNPDLTLREKRSDLGLHDDLCEDAPAWWLLKKKKTMYHNGGGDARSARSLMQFMMSPLNLPGVFEREEATFRDIRAYLLSLEAPKYPLAIDRAKAAAGKVLFADNCARCHGTYGEKWTYPNKIVPLKQIGTDPTRLHGITQAFNDEYNGSWFAKEKGAAGYKAQTTAGYQAPPLDGIWATAPYFHNGSAPTVYHVLNSKARPRIFTRSYRTGKDDYDPVKLGWKVTELKKGPDPDLPRIEQRKVYDTTQSGRGNGGHTFGDSLTDEERFAVIEYLKTL
jgi:mono/diheme cytochrome c family protein